MSLVACAICRQPFYASCHDGACIDATCPYCEYEDAGGDGAIVAGAVTDTTAALIVQHAAPTAIAGVRQPASWTPAAHVPDDRQADFPVLSRGGAGRHMQAGGP